MAEGTGLNPIAVIIAILAAAKLAGIVGVLLAVPAAIIVKVVVDEWLEQRLARQGAGEEGAPARVRGFE
jgi:predicted PurR-regulated permease PerM